MLLLLTLDKVADLESVAKGDGVMENVKDTIIELSQDEAMILCYNEDKYKEEVRQMVTETEKIKARKEGHEEGLKEGRRITLNDTVRKMIENGFLVEVISNITNLSIDEIEHLKK